MPPLLTGDRLPWQLRYANASLLRFVDTVLNTVPIELARFSRLLFAPGFSRGGTNPEDLEARFSAASRCWALSLPSAGPSPLGPFLRALPQPRQHWVLLLARFSRLLFAPGFSRGGTNPEDLEARFSAAFPQASAVSAVVYRTPRSLDKTIRYWFYEGVQVFRFRAVSLDTEALQ